MFTNFLRRIVSRTLKQMILLKAVIVVGLLLGVACTICLGHAYSHDKDDNAVFGPRKFDRDRGKPEVEKVKFSVAKAGTDYTIRLVNGGEDRDRDRDGDRDRDRDRDRGRDGDSDVSSAKISLNGVEVISPPDFSHHVNVIERKVTLQKSNVLTVLLVGKPGSFITITITGTGNIVNVNVPNVVGMTQTAAQVAIASADLVVGTVTSASSSTIPAGSVISQNPVAGASAVQGSSINLVVSSGPPTSTVPNVVGMTQANAQAAITSANLVVGTVSTASSSTVPSGSVISQNPVAGATVVQGSAANLVVSSGPPTSAVPNVVGMTQADAQAAITSANLVVGTVTTASSSTAPAGSVISQNPVAGATAVQGSSVDLVVSSGPPTSTVPSVVGLTQANAQTAITSVNLVVGTVTSASSNTVPAGSVISQSPVAGATAVQDSSVDLVVSSGPPIVTVPNVVGMTQADAQSAISSATLVVGTVTSAFSNAVSAGIVISQNPSAGANISSGTAVALVVSSGPPPLTVPDVTGLVQQAAKDALVAKGLTLGTVTSANSATVIVGNVISQNPAAGSPAAPGIAVSIVISLGPAASIKVVPQVIGLSQTDAVAAISHAGLSIGSIGNDYSSSVPSGSVISQYALAGTSLPSGSAINLIVSLGSVITPPVPPDPQTIAPSVDLSVATTVAASTSFLYDGANPIQTGVPAGAIESQRATILRGLVTDSSKLPVAGVNISVKDHPEFGQTFTQSSGMFDMAVNGGGVLTVTYEKTGYLPAQRQINAPWNGFVQADDVILIPLDTQVTQLTLTGSTPVQVARGSVMTDVDGTRQATLIVPQGTLANMVMPDGSTQPIMTLSVRATEYTVGPNGPLAMPGPLPSTSAYTYAVELSVDEAITAGATGINFDRPVYSYVENFLKFPVGGTVPAGYYDPKKAAWIPSANGRVIKLLASNAGSADLDTDGSGLAADSTKLAALGITDAERQQLASLYAPGQSFWRVPITHFTAWDYNFPLWGPPTDATAPNQPFPDDAWKPVDNPCTQKGSIIECQNQTLGESAAITGTLFALNYRSDRVPGRTANNKLTIPVSSSSVPASLKGITLEIQVAGQKFVHNLPPRANQNYDFIWDGTDAYGRKLNGVQKVRIRIGYTYSELLYSTPALYEYSFAMVSNQGGGNGGSNMVFGNPRNAYWFTLWQEYDTTIGNWTSMQIGLGAWLLNAHHDYDPSGGILHMGNGASRKVQWQSSSDGIISTVAGNGTCSQGNDGPATGASIWANDLALGNDGNIFFQEPFRTRKISPDGNITTIAGHIGPGSFNGSRNCGTVTGDGGPAIGANITCATWFTVAPDNSIYMSNIQRPDQNYPATSEMRRIGTDGIINPFLAISSGYITAAPNGDLFYDNGTKIYRMSSDGKVSLFAGNGNYGFNGDSIPATAASLYSSSKHLAFGHDGSVYIADTRAIWTSTIPDYINNTRIRRVSPDGIITTVAGSGKNTLSPDYAPLGDGGPAIYASFADSNNSVGIAVGPDDSIFIGDYNNYRIRRVGTDGIITTVAGNGQSGYNGDNISAKTATLSNVQNLVVGPDGSIYFVEYPYNCRIRKITYSPGGSLDEFLVAAEDGSEIYVFDATGRHLRTINPLTNAVLYRFGYDVSGRLATVTDGDGNVTTIEHDGSGNPTAIVAPFGQRTSLTVDSNGYLNTITNPAGETIQMSYTTDGLMTSFTHPKGNASQFQYDSMGFLTRDENAAGGFSALASTRGDNTSLVALTTAMSRITTYLTKDLINGDQQRTITLPTGASSFELIGANDATHQTTSPDNTLTTVTKTPDPRFGMQDPLTTTVIKTPAGLTLTLSLSRTVSLAIPNNPASLTSETDTLNFNGQTYTSVFDGTLKQQTTTTPVGRKYVSLLDSQGRTLSFTPAPGLTPLTISYYSFGKPQKVAQGNQQLNYAYDFLGRLASRVDARGNTVHYGYDNADRLTQLTFPSGRSYGFAYDANGNRTQITMPSGAVHKLGYTVIDLNSDYTPPANLPYAWAYNLDQDWTRTTLPGGRTVDAAYDTGGRLTGIVYPEASVGLFYNDKTDRVSSLTRSPVAGGTAQQITYAYDGSLVTGETFTGLANGAFTYTYDNNFFLKQIGFVSGSDTITTPITRDTDGLVTNYGTFTFARSGPAGAVSSISDTAMNITITYDTLGRVASRTHTVNGQNIYYAQFTYDNTGNISQKTENIPNLPTALVYTYDADGQLVKTQNNGADAETFAYDVNGNRTSYDRPDWTGALTANYDSQDRLQQAGGTAYQFNADGQLTQRGSDTFQYSATGELLQATVSGQTITYSYDGMGRRVARTDSKGTCQYLYGNLNQLFQLTAMRDPAGVLSYYYYDDTGKLFAFDKGGTRYYVATDQVGTPKVVSDATGNVVKYLEHDSFGMWTYDSNPDFDMPVGYAGGIVDSQTTLVRFGYRDYEPWTGRWAARDPIFFAGGQGNLFGYVQNNPLNWIDPEGLMGYIPYAYRAIASPAGQWAQQKATSYNAMPVVSECYHKIKNFGNDLSEGMKEAEKEREDIEKQYSQPFTPPVYNPMKPHPIP